MEAFVHVFSMVATFHGKHIHGKGKETSDLLFTQDNTIKEESLSALLALGFTKKVAYKKMEEVMKNYEGEITLEELVRRSLG